MENGIAITAKNISKTFHISEDSHNTVKHRLFNLFNPPRRKDVLALKSTSLEIKKGECIGLIGRNGCGKTTLTKVLAGVYPTDTGQIKINGSTMLMNLGIGMSHELTARENIYVSGSVLGLKIKEVDKLFDAIVDFAEIKDFIDTKVKFFSSGMMARLAFSIAVNAGADIMFLDEIFSVGDMKFQEKAVKVFEGSWIRGKTVVLVSHGMEVIRKYCNRSAFMKHGQIEFFGDTDKAIELYNKAREELRKDSLWTTSYITICNKLVNVYLGIRQYQKAESIILEVKEIREKIFGKEHPEYAKSCSILAFVYWSMGQYDKAEPLYLEAKQIREKVQGKEHPDYATACDNLAILYWSKGEYDKAEPLYLESKQIREKVLGKEHPDYAKTCKNLGG